MEESRQSGLMLHQGRLDCLTIMYVFQLHSTGTCIILLVDLDKAIILVITDIKSSYKLE